MVTGALCKLLLLTTLTALLLPAVAKSATIVARQLLRSEPPGDASPGGVGERHERGWSFFKLRRRKKLRRQRKVEHASAEKDIGDLQYRFMTGFQWTSPVMALEKGQGPSELLKTHRGDRKARLPVLRRTKESAVDDGENLNRSLYDAEVIFSSRNHCRLRRALADRLLPRGSHMAKAQWLPDRKVIVAASGGSATQGAGGVGVKNSWFNILGRRLGNVSIRNAAQGGTDSFWSALTLDSIVSEADIIFWEYGINDYRGGSTGFPSNSPTLMRQELEMWLRAAAKLERRPAVVMVYFYDGVEKNLRDTLFTSTALQAQIDVVRRAEEQGLDVLVIPAGPVLRQMGRAALSKDDGFHPSRKAHNLVARLVEKELYIAANSAAANCDWGPHFSARGNIQPDKSSWADAAPTWRNLGALNSVSTTAFEPHFRSDDIAPIAVAQCGRSDQDCKQAQLASFGKADALRNDRKKTWRIPTCMDMGLPDGVPPDFVQVHNKLTIGLLDENVCAKAKLITLRVTRSKENSDPHPWRSELVVQTGGKRFIINRNTTALEHHGGFFGADGTIPDMKQVPEAMTLWVNVYIDLTPNAMEHDLVDTANKQDPLAVGLIDEHSVDDTEAPPVMPENKCRTSLCAVRAQDENFRWPTIWQISVFY